MNIINNPTVTLNQCYNFTSSIKNANKLCYKLIPVLYSEAIERGINPAIAIAQAYKETGYFNFSGVLDESYHNVCGLKIPSGGGDYDKNAHKRFENWNQGINAYLDHLALYAGAKGYPKYSKELEGYYKSKNIKYDKISFSKNGNTLDPRHFPYLIGKCKTIETLSGNWAPGSKYGEEIIDLVKRIEKASNAPYKKEEDIPKEENTEPIKNKKAEEIISKITELLNELKKVII